MKIQEHALSPSFLLRGQRLGLGGQNLAPLQSSAVDSGQNSWDLTFFICVVGTSFHSVMMKELIMLRDSLQEADLYSSHISAIFLKLSGK